MDNKMSSRKDQRQNERSEKSSRDTRDTREPEVTDDEDVIDLCDDHDYQVLSAVFETDSGKNVADILSRLQKDVHLLAVSVHQLIQLSLASQNVKNSKEESDAETSESESETSGSDQEETKEEKKEDVKE